MPSKKSAAFTPSFTANEAGQVKAAFLAAGAAEGDANVSDFIVRAIMREVKRLQRKHNQGTKWDPAPLGSLRRDSAAETSSSTGPRESEAWGRGPKK